MDFQSTSTICKETIKTMNVFPLKITLNDLSIDLTYTGSFAARVPCMRQIKGKSIHAKAL